MRGIFTPNITPTTPDGKVDYDKLCQYVDWLIERGVHGLYPNGSTGEFTRFSSEERREIMRQLTAHVNGRVPILAGAAEENVQATIRTCECYAELGVTAVAIVAPFYYRLSQDAVFEYFAAIAREAPIDVTLYNIPAFASPIDVSTVQRLALEYPRVVGIKDSSGDIPHMMRMLAAIRPQRPDFRFLTGWDACLVPMLLAGCDGGTNATSGVVPELTRAIFDQASEGNWSAAMDLQNRLLPLFDTMVGTENFPEGFRQGLLARGWDLGTSRQPASPTQSAAAKTAGERLKSLLDDPMFNNP